VWILRHQKPMLKDHFCFPLGKSSFHSVYSSHLLLVGFKTTKLINQQIEREKFLYKETLFSFFIFTFQTKINKISTIISNLNLKFFFSHSNNFRIILLGPYNPPYYYSNRFNSSFIVYVFHVSYQSSIRN
jgi:hypothetical protein